MSSASVFSPVRLTRRPLKLRAEDASAVCLPPVPERVCKETLAIDGQFRYQFVKGAVNQFLR
jgi:hypothetical protein